MIDGEDISKLSLNGLRSRLSIIPQDPVLFTGSVRFNLDPFQEHSDEEVWMALERAFLRDHIERQPERLDYAVAEVSSLFLIVIITLNVFALHRTVATSQLGSANCFVWPGLFFAVPRCLYLTKRLLLLM